MGRGWCFLESCWAEGDKMGETRVCWAQALKVQSLGVKARDREGFPAGYGAMVAGEHISWSLEPETRYDFWYRRPTPHALPLRELSRSFCPPTVSNALAGSPLLLCWVPGAWLLVLAREPGQASTAPPQPLIPETVSALCRLQRRPSESPLDPPCLFFFWFGLAQLWFLQLCFER